jgi:hypothetical protein
MQHQSLLCMLPAVFFFQKNYYTSYTPPALRLASAGFLRKMLIVQRDDKPFVHGTPLAMRDLPCYTFHKAGMLLNQVEAFWWVLSNCLLLLPRM